MPRSGSTLLEQILSRHPEICCAGETTTFGEKLAMIRRDSADLHLSPHSCGRSVPNRSSACPRPIACTCTNGARRLAFLSTSFLAISCSWARSTWPCRTRGSLSPTKRARHVLLRLHQLFWIPCSLQLRSWRTRPLLSQIRTGDRVLGAGPPGWRNADRHYEEVVSDIETQARSLLDFLGLPWDPACLTFHRSSHPVRTASVAQVRRPLYQNSVGRWRRYESHLQPLVDALGTYA